MTVDVIKREIPAKISAEGGATVQIVGKTTVPLASSVHEAKEGMLVVGDELLVRGQFEGMLRSMAQGVARDGHSRQLGDYLTVYAQPYGPVDLERGWDPAVNGFMLKARLLNEMEIDITEWTFRDVTPGRVPFRLNSASTGERDHEVAVGEEVHLNGTELPPVGGAKVEWAVEGTDKGGTVAAEKLAGDCDRIDIAADALAELASAEYDGKKVVFTVRGNFSSTKISATLRYAAPPPAPKPTLTNAHSPGCDPMEVTMHEDVILDGTRLKGFERLVAHHEECAEPIELPTEGVTASDDGTQLSLPGSVWDAITAKVDPSVMPTRPITFEVITGEGSASISPTVP